MRTEFFASRTLARNFASENGGKVKDFGKDAAAGERWAVLSEVVAAVEVAPAIPAKEHSVEIHSETTASLAAALKAVDVAKPAPAIKDRISFLNANNFEKKVVEVAHVAVKEVRNIIAGIIGEQVLTTPNDKRVRVMYRRSLVPIRLAQSIAKSA